MSANAIDKLLPQKPSLKVNKKLAYLERHLTLWIFLAIFIGISLSSLIPQLPMLINRCYVGKTNVPIAIGLIAMMYPPLAKIDYSQMRFVFKDIKILGVSLLFNWILGPILMFILAILFLHNYPHYMVGVILIGLARCIAMVMVWNDLAGGNKEYCAGLVALNSLFQVLLFSLYTWLFIYYLPKLIGLHSFHLEISILEVIKNVFMYLGVSFIIGFLSRTILIKTKGLVWYENEFSSRVGFLTLIALLFTVVVMFSLKGSMILSAPSDVVKIALPLICYFTIMFFLAMLVSKRLGADYSRSTTLAFTAAGNNFELAIAVAISTFGLSSAEAFSSVVGPLIEIPALILLVNLALKLKSRFKNNHH